MSIKPWIGTLLVLAIIGGLGAWFFPSRASAAATFVKLVERDVVASSSTVSTGNFASSVTTGNLLVIRVFYNSASRSVFAVTDSKNNGYAKAVGPTTGSGAMAGWRQEIWFAKNVTGGSGLNVTATFDASFNAEKAISAHEYSGLDTAAPLDVTAAQASGSMANASSGTVTTTTPVELIFGAALYSGCGSPGSGFSGRSSLGCNVSEDRSVTTAGAYAAVFTNSAQSVIAQMATFRVAGQTLDTTAPSVPAGLAATVVSMTQVGLSWQASTDNVAVTGYRVERCAGTGCTTFAEIGTPTGTSLGDSGLATGTSYSYRVRATDAAGNLSAYSNTATATLPAPDTTPPTAPAGLTATAVSATQITLAWTAATDNVGTTGYQVFRNGAQIATTTGTSFSNTGLVASTPYTYAVDAFDAAGNVSGLSTSVSVTTPSLPSDTTPPSVPVNLVATAQSSSAIALSWAPSTDDVGVIGYEVYQGATRIGTATSTTYSDTGLTASTLYSYAVAAYDAAGNTSAQSASASAVTQAPPAATSYSTNFPLTENPISEGGQWAGGSTAGGNLWGNVQTTPGLAFGVSEPTQFGDPTAILQGTWGSNQTAQATIKINTTPTGTCCHEAEVRLRNTIRSESITGYEVYCSVMPDNPYCHIASWGGPNGAYVNMDDSSPALYLKDGDVLAGTVTGTNPVTITLFINGSQVLTVQDTGTYTFSDGKHYGPWTTGNPGFGFYDQGDDNWNRFGFSSFTASDGGSAPSAPTPAGGATNIGTTPTLTWIAAGATSYDVNFGATTPPPSVSTGQSTATYTPAPLAGGTTYYWQVTAYSSGGTMTGPIWSFTTVPKTTPTIIWSTPASIVYPTALSETQLNATASVPGAFVYSPAAGTVLNAGVGQTLSVTFTPTETANYTTATASVAITVTLAPPPDTTPPSVPADVTASAQSSAAIALAWSASTDNVGVVGYRIYRGGTQVGATASTSYSDTGLVPSTAYTYQIAAYDAANNASTTSTPVSAATAALTASGILGAATCSQADVQNAINAALDGYVVVVPAGTCTWTTPAPNTPAISIYQKAVTLQGAGIDQTVINTPVSTAPGEVGIRSDGVEGKRVRIAGFTFSGGSNLAEIMTIVGTSKDFRVDHNTFTAPGVGTAVYVAGATYGLLDHNTFHNARVFIEGDGDGSWQRPLDLGGAGAAYLEDNTVDFDVSASTISDRNGARYVFRHNTTNVGLASASTCASGARGTRSVEIYGNTLTATGAGGYLPDVPIALRSGTGVVFDNFASGPFGRAVILVDDERSDASSCAGIWATNPTCDGTGPYDGNTPGMSGYLCRDQIGASTDSGLASPQTIEPVYAWNNWSSNDGAPVDIVPGGGSGTALHIQANRDFFDAAKPGYTPYPYPHPLAAPPASDTEAPVVAITSPLSQAIVSGNVAVSAVAWDNVAVASVRFLLDGINLGPQAGAPPYAVSWASTGVAPGAHTLTAIASDAAGNTSVSPPVVVYTVDTAPPVVTLSLPVGGATVSGAGVSVSATAADNVGVAGVQFLLDGHNLGAEVTVSPYSITWNTTQATNGPHILTASARDAAGNVATSAAVTVTVSNPLTYYPGAYTVVTGTYVSGNTANLAADDNNYFVVNSTTSGTTRRSVTDFGFANVARGSRINYKVRLKSSKSSTAVVVYAFNYVSATWTQLSSSSIGTAEVTLSASISAAVANYISTDGNTLVRVQSSKTSSHSIYDELISVTLVP